MSVGLLVAERRWVCPNCQVTSVTHRADVHQQFHHCAGLAGMWAPMVEDGTRCKVIAIEREDYVGRERVQTDANGRPVMAVHVVRDDGQDAAIYAPWIDVNLSELKEES